MSLARVDRTDASGGSIWGTMKRARSTPLRLTAWLSDLSERGFTFHAHRLSSLWRGASLHVSTLIPGK